ncbi:MAG: GrpB family protein [Ktedonobacterales bacterium]|nr:GrpB family protein [Ktedonobacterales bacterium]
MSSPPIGHYEKLPAACCDWDPQAPMVAARIGTLITRHLPDVTVEHIGSTAIPGCAGKGIIDLQVLYPAGRLPAVRDALDSLGFQRQQGRDPWPEERPMRVGAVEHAGTCFRIHAHVVAADAPEVTATRAFRDRLRADATLRDAYMARKRAIIASGISDTYEYTLAKGDFVRDTLAAGEDHAETR